MKKFLPLIIIFTIIFLLSLVRQYFAGFDFMLWMNDFMAAFFLVFGGFKVINWKGFVTAYRMYDVVAKKSVVYAYLYPIIEIGLGLAYAFQFQPLATNIITLVVMSISTVGVARALMKKQKIQCACLGAVFQVPMTWVTLTEDILMAAMAFAMLIISLL